ncbi:DUF5686 family protein [Sunxiuqinia sp. sy24]|uniref:DUF5686 family protein n=1 Tax=Sunxiuqinia sp. sy24 TaxID=3461495 RepID=UPI00404669BE
MLHKAVMVILLIMSSFYARGIDITGYIQDQKSKEPIPFSNVLIKGTTQGTMADMNGFFKLSASASDTLYISSVGYFPKEILISQIENNHVVVLLEENVQQLNSVTIRPEVPRAKVLFNEIQKHKKENQKQVMEVANYKTLSNTTVYVAIDTSSNITSFINNLEEVTVGAENQELRFSPIYLSEEALSVTNNDISTVYQKKDGIFPQLNQSIESIILLNIAVDLDFYKDQVNILERGFISPLSNSAMSYYNIYLNDSTIKDGKKYFNFSFAPKNKFNPLFSGQFVVEDGSFALTEIDAYIAKEANLNFVNGFRSNVSYKHTPGEGWFYDLQDIRINLALSLNKDSLSTYSSKRADNISSGNWLINKSIHYSTSTRLNTIAPNQWNNQPEFEAHELNADSYSRVSKLKDQKIVKGIDAIGGLALTGFLNAGKLDIGPVFDIYSTNTIEGKRLTLPFRTSNKMFERFSIGGFLGYGTKNKAFKYGANLIYQPQETDKFLLRFSYFNDYSLITQDKYLRFIKKNPNNKGNGNFIAALTTKEPNPYLKEEQSFELRFEYNAPNDIHLEAAPYLLESTKTPNVRFIRNSMEYNKYKNYGLLFNLRIPFGQHYDKFYFDRIYYSTTTPVVNLSWDIGKTSLRGQEDENLGLYSQFHGSIQGRVNMGQVFMSYMLNGGYLIGDAPYDLLDQPVGSMSLGYAKYRFNLLHHASFAHNLYSNTHLHFNGGGILLNRIPLFRRLKLREIISFKGHYGKLNDSYQGVFDLPDYYANDPGKPYAEIGFGLTNIFKVLRVEYISQLGSNYADTDFTDRNGIRFRAEMSF